MSKDIDERALGLLRSHEFWTASDLAQDLNVSLRTVRRVLARMVNQGIALDSSPGRGGGIRLASTSGLHGLRLEHREVLNLLLSLAIAESLQSPLILSGLTGLRQKLGLALPLQQRKTVSALRRRILVGNQAAKHIKDTLQQPSALVVCALQDAFFLRRTLRICYVDQKGCRSLRQIEPHYLLLNWPIWYVLGFDLEKNASRTFRLDRIESAMMEETRFALKAAALLMPNVTEFFGEL